MKLVILHREDFNNPLHPFLFDEICEEFGLESSTTDSIDLEVLKANVSGEDFSEKMGGVSA